MKLKQKIYVALAFGLLVSCNDDDIQPTYTVGAADNAIVLRAGIGEGGEGVMTRAAGDPHVAFSATTQTRLYVKGEWHGTVTKYTNCTTRNADYTYDGSANDTHPLGSFNPQLYWDDYGTADPDNSTSRDNGLAVYGVAVEGLSTLPNDLNSITDNSWTNLSWAVKTDGTNVLQKDIIVSNNHGDNSASDKTGIKFDQRTDDKTNENYNKNILIYQHMMSKVTFVLTAGEGFTNGKFTNAPEIILTRNLYGQSTIAEWCNTSGTVNIKTATANGSSVGTVKLQHLNTTDAGVVTEHALVFPGSNFGANDNDIIARINADGNIYYVTSEKIRAAITTKYGSGKENGFATQSGVNYIIDVKIKKTKIEVTATITNWDPITAEEVTPVINVGASYGSNSNNFGKDAFSFYRSTAMNNGYSAGYSGNANVYFAPEATVSNNNGTWTFSTPLYWPTHDTHYQMRGVWPKTVTDAAADDGNPRVETATHSGVDYQVIKVKNVQYSEGTFPSDLAIGRPDVATTATCSNSDHEAKNLYSDGICATEGKVNLAFEYMMSKVEVNLSTTDGNNQVNLTGAVVEVTNLYTTGDIKLGDRGAIPTGSPATYVLHETSTANKFLDAIVPQTLTYSTAGATTNVRFKITITNNDAVMYANADEYNTDKGYSAGNPGYCTDFSSLTTEQKTKTPATKDIYYADVNPILKSGSTAEKVAPNGKWESGKYYKYNLKLSKTKIDVTATLKDWVPVTASEEVWF